MIPVSEAREQLADLVNRAAYRHERITLGRRGKKIAAIVSAEDLELLEALEDAADLRLIAKALADPANGQPPISWSAVATELAKRGRGMKATVSEKGEVTIPKRLRERLGIRAGQMLDFEERDGILVARKAGSDDPVGEVYGSLKLGEPIDDFVRRIRGPHARR
jgi:antitoxin PrlF